MGYDNKQIGVLTSFHLGTKARGSYYLQALFVARVLLLWCGILDFTPNRSTVITRFCTLCRRFLLEFSRNFSFVEFVDLMRDMEVLSTTLSLNLRFVSCCNLQTLSEIDRQLK